MNDVRGVNTNALVALDAMLESGSVTAAARTLGVSQSALSNTLAKLRVLFGDPLLVRKGRGLVPTAVAQRIRGPLRQSIEGLQRVLRTPEAFDPSVSTLRVRLKANDYALSIFLRPLVDRLREQAPDLRVEFVQAGHFEDFNGLDSGSVDAYIGFCDGAPPGHFEEPLIDEHLVCIVRRDHPIVGRRLTLKRYVRCEHVIVSSTAQTTTLIDAALTEQGLQRKVMLAVPYFLLVPALVADTDLLAATNSRTASSIAERFALDIHPLPLSLRPGTLSLVWHARTQGDPGHAWFRQVLRKLANTL